MAVDRDHFKDKFDGHQIIQTTSNLFIGGLAPKEKDMMRRGATDLVQGSMKTLSGALFRDLTFNGK